MTASAILLGLTGLSLTFMGDEILSYLGVTSSTTMHLISQLLGALYFGFAMMNWMSKTSRIGGIYNRPIVIANLTHFTVGGLALTKEFKHLTAAAGGLVLLTIVYFILAASFGYLLFKSPVKPVA